MFDLAMAKDVCFTHVTLPVAEKKILSASANGAALRRGLIARRNRNN